MPRYESALADWPHTRTVQNDGVQISGSYGHPRVTGILPALYTFCAVMLSAMVMAILNSLVAVVGAGIVFWFLYPTWKKGMLDTLGTQIDVRIFADRIEIRKSLFAKHYTRSVPIAFWIEPNYAAFLDHTPAVEVVMQYGERRIVIAQMRLAEIGHAEALLTQLQRTMHQTARSAVRAGVAVPGNNFTLRCYSA